ncbi:hypothetical protein TKWG_21685 [Advenella kashmirensis WT001]|uniref:Uncharacterized protein n=1 Tax=Advenella kashmirensis (strain DSM 17095 / LMG 22695 / WT001) TaxID=1036672 RepID=I3UG80_ADVKW|nr:hypothetical protein TKWG_21685 [Advenella kashmirensis WT001]
MLAGPILRRLEPGRLALWLVGSVPLKFTLLLAPAGESPRSVTLDATNCRIIPIGRHAFLHLIDVALSEPLPQDTVIAYDLVATLANGVEANIAQWAPHLLHEDATQPTLVLRSRADDILFGSCRKPHHPARDGWREPTSCWPGTSGRPTHDRPCSCYVATRFMLMTWPAPCWRPSTH